MATNFRDTMKGLSPARRKKIKARAAALIAEEMSLRQALPLTQERMAETLGIGQDGVSRLEKRSDLLLSTLRTYIEAMGGQLLLIAEFPDREPVTLSGLATMETAPHPPTRPRRPIVTTACSLFTAISPSRRRPFAVLAPILCALFPSHHRKAGFPIDPHPFPRVSHCPFCPVFNRSRRLAWRAARSTACPHQ